MWANGCSAAKTGQSRSAPKRSDTVATSIRARAGRDHPDVHPFRAFTGSESAHS
jgi:hypothetical protein